MEQKNWGSSSQLNVHKVIPKEKTQIELLIKVAVISNY